MGDVTSLMHFTPVNSVGGNLIIADTDGDETVDDADTFTVDLAKYGIKKFLGVVGFIATTKDSVLAQEQPTTSVAGDTLTVTVGGATDNKERVYFIYGR